MREVLTDPQKLRDHIDKDTMDYARRANKKQNPFPELRLSDGERHKVIHTQHGTARVPEAKGQRDVSIGWMYMIRCVTGHERRNARRIDSSRLDLVTLLPIVRRTGKKDELVYPGHIFVAFDHPMTAEEFQRLSAMHVGVIYREAMPRKVKVLIQTQAKRGDARDG